MKALIVPVNDPGEAEAAVRRAVDAHRRDAAPVHLLNVQRPLPMHIAQFFDREELAQVHREAGMRVLERAARLLDDAHVPYEAHVLVGKPAETIVSFAEQHPGADLLMDTAAPGLLSRLGIGSIGSQVRHLLDTHGGGAAPEASAR